MSFIALDTLEVKPSLLNRISINSTLSFKEPKFFSTDFNRELEKSLGNNFYQVIKTVNDYNQLFIDGVGKIKGDFNPFNILSVDAAKNIYDYNPKAKIIISIREPISFLRSFHFQSLFRMIENETNFLKALSLEEERRTNKNIPKYCHNPFYLYYSSLIEYKDQIKRFTDVFGNKKIKVFLFDDIVTDEYKVYQEVLLFLNAKNIDFVPPRPERNPSHSLRFAWLRRIIFTPPVRKWFYTRIPHRLFIVGGKTSQWIFKKQQDKPFVSEQEIARLKMRYKPNVDELNQFLSETGLIKQDIARLWNY